VKILIYNTQMVLPNGKLYAGDLLSQDGRIQRIDRAITDAHPDRAIDGSNQVLLPGVIDPQVHFREPGKEHKEDLHTASRACVRGGVTSFLEMPNTDPLTTDQATLDDKLQRAAAKSLANYGFFIGATSERNVTDLESVHPTCGIKIFMGSQGGKLLVDKADTLEYIFANTTRLIAVHAENQARILNRRQEFAGQTDPAIHSLIQDDEAALEATQLALDLATRYRHRLHVLHLSTAKEVDLLRRHKPAWVTAEVTPQHLLLDTSAYTTLGTLAQMNPPLRSPHDCEVLWQGLHDGTLDFIATDHAPHTLAEKAQGYPDSPSGMPGVETSLPLMLTAMQQGRCRLNQVVRWMSSGPAEGYGIVNKGRIQLGYDADLVLVDLETVRPVRREELQTKCGWSPFEGWELTGWPTVTLVLGQVAWCQGNIDDTVRGQALQFEAEPVALSPA
jgi:dihydroorotase